MKTRMTGNMIIIWTVESISELEVREYMRTWAYLYDDGCDGLNITKLAEETAYDLEIFEEDGETIPDCVFELAAEVDDWYCLESDDDDDYED
jgi:hypothetical protein